MTHMCHVIVFVRSPTDVAAVRK